jgi:predicted enzyme related to lactoylglutathione lyase
MGWTTALAARLLVTVRPDRPTKENDMTSTIQPVILTPDLDRLLTFYTATFDAKEVGRVPADGPTFYVGLQIGDSTLGIVADNGADVEAGDRQRILISVEVDDVDVLLPQIEGAGGRVEGPPNDMPWGQRVAHVQDPDGNGVNLTQPI